MQPATIVAVLAALVTGGAIGSMAPIGERQSGERYENNQSRVERSANYQPDNGMYMQSEDFVSMRPYIASSPVENLDTSEREDLIYMREEEKLARDVYTTLGEKWNQQIFFNIANSEQTHTEAIRDLLDKYKLDDPVKNDVVGVFTNTDLAALYNELVEQGSVSLSAALTVGATIEDLDIRDLDTALSRTDNDDIAAVYQRLKAGSENHLRAFARQLTKAGEVYTPAYISEADYQTIVTANTTRGNNSGQGMMQDTTSQWGWGVGMNRR